MELQIRSIESGGTSDKLQVADAVFATEFNEPLVHQVVTAYLAASRSGTKAQKTRSEVRGGGIKPWRQKGTGRARSGTIRSPIWRGGGRTFAAQPRDYSQKVNRKMYRGAIRSILAELIRQERLVLIDDIELQNPKTRELVAVLKTLNLENVLIIAEKLSRNLFLAARNVTDVGLCETSALDPVILLRYDYVLITRESVKRLEESLQ